MSFKTIEVVLCDTCGIPLTASEDVMWGRTTDAQRDRLTRKAVDAGWGYDPGNYTPGKPVTHPKHYCPDHKPEPVKGKRK